MTINEQARSRILGLTAAGTKHLIDAVLAIGRGDFDGAAVQQTLSTAAFIDAGREVENLRSPAQLESNPSITRTGPTIG